VPQARAPARAYQSGARAVVIEAARERGERTRVEKRKASGERRKERRVRRRDEKATRSERRRVASGTRP